MLLNDFYSISDQTNSLANSPIQGEASMNSLFTVEFNAGHQIFHGHFPGNPVVPGVCQVQMIKELLELTLHKEMVLVKSDNIKFLAMISPSASGVVQVDLDIREKPGEMVETIGTISGETMIFLKFKGIFKTAEATNRTVNA